MANAKESYIFEDFISACIVGREKVFVTGGAMETAKSDFNLKTQMEVLNFIGTSGLEQKKFRYTTPWQNNPNPSTTIMVDSYDFCSGPLFGYIAFLFQPIHPKGERWIIKSFKKNNQPDQRNLALAKPLAQIREQLFGRKK